MSSNVEVKPLTEAEMESLLGFVSEARAAQEAQDKFVMFLRKQHDAPARDGWGLTEEGFKREGSKARAEMQREAGNDKAPSVDGA